MLPTGVNGDELQNVGEASSVHMGSRGCLREHGLAFSTCQLPLVVWPRATALRLKPGPARLASGFWLEHKPIATWEI